MLSGQERSGNARSSAAERLVDRARRGERSEIVAVLAFGAAVPADPRERLRRGDLADVDVGERLVVAQDDVERRPVPLDQVALEQQRLDVARRGHHLQIAGQRHHALQPRAQRRRLGVGGQPLLQRLGLADVEHLALVVEHPVDPGPVRQGRHVALDQRRPAQPARAPRLAARAAPPRGGPHRIRLLCRAFHETPLFASKVARRQRPVNARRPGSSASRRPCGERWQPEPGGNQRMRGAPGA